MSIDCTIQEQTGEAFSQVGVCRVPQAPFSLFQKLLSHTEMQMVLNL